MSPSRHARWIPLLLALHACTGAPAREPDAAPAQRAQAIVGGAADPGDPAVVALVRRRLHCHEPFVETYCTGVLVADRVVLTAAHCVADEPILDLEVYVGANSNDGAGRFFAVADQQLHPRYNAAALENDLALLQLAVAPGVTPVPVTAMDEARAGDAVRVVGFGGEGHGSDGIKRAGTSRLAAVDALVLRTEPGPALACGGDSGAPVFLEGASGPRLVGVVRSGDAACTQFTNATRLAPYVADFVAPYLASPPRPRQRAAALTESLCSQSCVANADCPRGMLCLPERELGRLCGYANLRSGQIGAACTEDTQCGSGICAASGPGDEGRTCGCFDTCRDLRGRVSEPPRLTGGAGCSSAPYATRARPWSLAGAPWALSALSVVAWARSARRRARARGAHRRRRGTPAR